MKIFISGKITGEDLDEAKRKFFEAECLLLDQGHNAINPMEMADWNLSWYRYMRISRTIIYDDSLDAMYMLRDWMESPGARREHMWAENRGIKIFYQDYK